MSHPSMITVDYSAVRTQQNIMKDIFDGCWKAASQAGVDGIPYCPDVLLCNPPTLVHVHLAEKLQIPLQIWLVHDKNAFFSPKIISESRTEKSIYVII